MNRLPKGVRRLLIRICYLLPAIGGTVMLIYAAIPHLWFVYDGAAHDTLSLFGLVQNTWEECQAIFSATEGSSQYAVYFSYTMSAFTVLFWIAVICFSIAALLLAVCSILAFAQKPTARRSNIAKRVLYLYCPNRILFLLFQLFPILWAAFPQILVHFYFYMMGYSMTVHTFLCPDLVLASMFSALTVALFLLTLPSQAELKLDMFRIYKAKKTRSDDATAEIPTDDESAKEELEE